MKPKFMLAAILSSAVIASGVLLSSVTYAQPCSLSKFDYYAKQDEPGNWLRSPLVAVITLPGLAIAAALALGERYYKG